LCEAAAAIARKEHIRHARGGGRGLAFLFEAHFTRIAGIALASKVLCSIILIWIKGGGRPEIMIGASELIWVRRHVVIKARSHTEAILIAPIDTLGNGRRALISRIHIVKLAATLSI